MTDAPAPPPLDETHADDERPRIDHAPEPDPSRPHPEIDEEAIDEELANTFPASDPPSRNGTT